jgi:hypothetical protein
VDKVDVRSYDIINPNLGLGILDFAPAFGMALAIGESTLSLISPREAVSPGLDGAVFTYVSN